MANPQGGQPAQGAVVAKTAAGQHTPGPWHFTTKYAKGCGATGHVYGPDCVVAVVGGYDDAELLPFNKARWDADKALIAAAPELLAALREADTELRLFLDVDMVCDHSVGICACTYNRMRENMRAALERAK